MLRSGRIGFEAYMILQLACTPNMTLLCVRVGCDETDASKYFSLFNLCPMTKCFGQVCTFFLSVFMDKFVLFHPVRIVAICIIICIITAAVGWLQRFYLPRGDYDLAQSMFTLRIVI